MIKAPLSGVPGAGSANPLCAKPFNAEAPGARLRPSTLGKPWSENFQSVATHVTYGNFRLVDLGDLNWDQERNFVCPTNLLGTADLYVATAHGQQISGPEVLVHALRPRAIVMNNALKKGGDSPTMAVVRSFRGRMSGSSTFRSCRRQRMRRAHSSRTSARATPVTGSSCRPGGTAASL